MFRKSAWGVFFVICGIIIITRIFIIHPYRIPSGSMLPTLHVGDFIWVNKTSYGFRLPITGDKLFTTADPQRGEVMVFRFPPKPELTYIKRVIGVPGDTITYHNKQLSINGSLIDFREDGEYIVQDGRLNEQAFSKFTESLSGLEYSIILDRRLVAKNMEVVVPEGHYFVMGDNRDHSNDSRNWRFVPEKNIIGKAFYIWFNWKGASKGGVDWDRIGRSID